MLRAALIASVTRAASKLGSWADAAQSSQSAKATEASMQASAGSAHFCVGGGAFVISINFGAGEAVSLNPSPDAFVGSIDKLLDNAVSLVDSIPSLLEAATL